MRRGACATAAAAGWSARCAAERPSEPYGPEARTPHMADKTRKTEYLTPKQKAAHSHSGQDQEPKQSQKDSSSLWDTTEHSDAPGPFGTGKTWD